MCSEVPEATSARFCGRCGAVIGQSFVTPGTTTPGDGGTAHRDGARRLLPRHRVTVAVVGSIGMVVVVATVLATGATPATDTTDDLAVELPQPGMVPQTADDAAPDGGTATTDRLDGDITRAPQAGDQGRSLGCEPRGCEQWRVRLAGELQEVAVTDRWLAVVDSTRLRVRGTDPTNPGSNASAIDLRGIRTSDGEPALAEAPDGRVPVIELAIADDGTVLIGQRDRILALGPGGEFRWAAGANQLRAVEVHDDRVVVFSAPDGRPDSSLERATSRSLDDGAVAWTSHTGRPLDGATFGLLTLGPSDRLELIDPGTGAVRWGIDLEGPRWARLEGPWVVANRGRSDESLLLDGATGEVLQVYADLVPLRGIQRRDGVAVGTWLRADDTDRTAGQVVVIAWDEDGSELWRHEIPVQLDGPCCAIALPWAQGTVAIGQPAAPEDGWEYLDAATGQPRDPGGIDPPLLPLHASARSDQAPPRVGSMFAATDGDTLWLAAGAGTATVQGAAGSSLVSVDPPVLVRPGELIGLRLIPAG